VRRGVRALARDVSLAAPTPATGHLCARIGALLAAGGDIMAAPQVGQRAFARPEQVEALAGRNAQAAFRQMKRE